MDQELKVNIQAENGEVIVRTGEAAKVYDPMQVNLSGIISAPGDWASARAGTFGPLSANAVADYTARTITLRLDENSKFGTVVTGTLRINPELDPLGINSTKTYEKDELYKKLRFFGPYFADRDAHTTLLGKLKSFEGRVSQEFQSANDYKGQAAYKKLTEIKTNLDLEFLLSMPIFAGGSRCQFKVEICVDADTGAVRFWLESPELHEQIIAQTEELFEEELERLSKHATIVRKY